MGNTPSLIVDRQVYTLLPHVAAAPGNAILGFAANRPIFQRENLLQITTLGIIAAYSGVSAWLLLAGGLGYKAAKQTGLVPFSSGQSSEEITYVTKEEEETWSKITASALGTLLGTTTGYLLGFRGLYLLPFSVGGGGVGLVLI